jgi:hypothetical protein
MTTLVVERPVADEAAVLASLDFDLVTAVFVAPQSCSIISCAPLSGQLCCPGYECRVLIGEKVGFCNKI